MEEIPNLVEYRKERLAIIMRALSYEVELFLQLNGMNNVDIVWDEENDLQEVFFRLEEPDTHENLLTGERLHQDLIRYLAEKDLPELTGYTRNIHAIPNVISFIKLKE